MAGVDRVNLRNLMAERDRLLAERVARLSFGPTSTLEHLHTCAIEIAAVLALPDPRKGRGPLEETNAQVAALAADSLITAYARGHPGWADRVRGRVSRQLGATGEHIPLRDPVGRPWTGASFFGFVRGILFSMREGATDQLPEARWRLGPNVGRIWGASSGRQHGVLSELEG
jgi:hypothetical protein